MRLFILIVAVATVCTVCFLDQKSELFYNLFGGGGAHLGPTGIEIVSHYKLLNKLDDKLRAFDNSPLEGVKLEGKTFAELVPLGVFDREDAIYVRKRKIRFHGYKVPHYPAGGERTVRFEEMLNTELNHRLLKTYNYNGDGSESVGCCPQK